jgi:hypothetical protein
LFNRNCWPNTDADTNPDTYAAPQSNADADRNADTADADASFT